MEQCFELQEFKRPLWGKAEGRLWEISSVWRISTELWFSRKALFPWFLQAFSPIQMIPSEWGTALADPPGVMFPAGSPGAKIVTYDDVVLVGMIGG